MTDHVKGLGWKEYHTAWSAKVKPRTIECLKEHILRVVRDSQLKQKPIAKPSEQMPMKKKLPSLGIKTHDARKKDEEHVTELSSVEQQSKSVRDSLIDSGKRDEMAMKQPKCAPDLK